MSKGLKRVFTREFKEEAIRLWEANGRRAKMTAEQLGIDPNYLPKWRHQLQGAGRSVAPDKSAGQPLAGSEVAEIARLKCELDRVKTDYEILKKTVAIFSKEIRK